MRPEPGPPLTVGERIEITIEKAVYRGLGLGRHDGRVIFVPRAFPGDRLRVRVATVERGFARATLEDVLDPAPGRRRAPCAHAARCGGCAYQELGYEAQRKAKGDILAEALRRAGASFPEPFEIVRSPETGWRTRATLHFEVKAGELRLGLHEEGTHVVVDLDLCPQLSPAMTEAARGLKAALQARPELWPGLRGLHLAEGNQAGLVATLETRRPVRDVGSFASLRPASPGLSGLAVLAEEAGREVFVLLQGSPRLGHEVAGLRLTSHARCFFQANRFLLDPLVAYVLAQTPAEGRALDLYAGVGLFALPLLHRGQDVRAVESDELAVADAQENARRLGLTRGRFEAADVRRALAAWPREDDEAVVLDPPRSGAGLDVVEILAARRPRAIVYVSCDPPTLGRDLAHFARFGYRTSALRAFDMFPDTFHLETVVRLVPAAL